MAGSWMIADGSELDYEGAAKKIERRGCLLDFGFILIGCELWDVTRIETSLLSSLNSVRDSRLVEGS